MCTTPGGFKGIMTHLTTMRRPGFRTMAENILGLPLLPQPKSLSALVYPLPWSLLPCPRGFRTLQWRSSGTTCLRKTEVGAGVKVFEGCRAPDTSGGPPIRTATAQASPSSRFHTQCRPTRWTPVVPRAFGTAVRLVGILNTPRNSNFSISRTPKSIPKDLG